MQKLTVRRVYMVTLLWTGLDRFRQVWASQNRCEVLFFLNRESHALQIRPTPKTCVQFSNCTSKVVETAFRHASSKVWTGVKCKFSWAHLQGPYVVEKLWISRVRMWNFTRIGRKAKMSQLLKIPARRRSHQPPLGQPQKGVNCNFSWPRYEKESLKNSQSRKLKYAVSAGWAKR